MTESVEKFKKYLCDKLDENKTYWGNNIDTNRAKFLNEMVDAFEDCFHETIDKKTDCPKNHISYLLAYKKEVLDGAIQELIAPVQLLVRGDIKQINSEYYVSLSYTDELDIETRIRKTTLAYYIVNILNYLELSRISLDYTTEVKHCALEDEVEICKDILLKQDAEALLLFLTTPINNEILSFYKVARKMTLLNFKEYYDTNLKGKMFCKIAPREESHCLTTIVTEKMPINEQNVICCVRDTLDNDGCYGGIISDSDSLKEFKVGEVTPKSKI